VLARLMLRRLEKGAARMSISSISGYSNLWQWQSLQNRGTSGSGATTDSITNSGTVSSNTNLVAYMQAFSADLQSMLTQMGSDASASANSINNTGSTSSTTASATSSTDPTQNPDAVHHHHHHHGGAGEGGSMDDAANQLVGEIGGATQSGTLTSSQISQSASLFATDVMQALESYGGVAPNGTTPPSNSTVA
jgi:hypothetical protein